MSSANPTSVGDNKLNSHVVDAARNYSQVTQSRCVASIHSHSKEETQEEYRAVLTDLPERTIKHFSDPSQHMDSSVWDDFIYREGDIIIGAWAKTGTTWTSQILTQLVFKGVQPQANIHSIVPWLELQKGMAFGGEVLGYLDKLDHVRVIKTHLPLNAIPYSPKARYVYVARNGMDAALSKWNHHNSLVAAAREKFLVGPPVSFDVFWQGFCTSTGPYWDYFEHVNSWWKYRHVPNIYFLHFDDLKQDLPGSIRKLAAFCNLEVADEQTFQTIVDHCTFEYMKKHEDLFTPPVVPVGSFIHQGKTGRWATELSAEQKKEYDEVCKLKFPPDLVEWLNRPDEKRAVKTA
ncbi:unnamed protein product [Didymodactylos carnosus]|uniref:Sulfotransferase domain-containing protein n=1 Tax=Didymodactylos carnosus TaxID=1234261 RepID=A0A815NVE2_9BILA|nr:unnamed protein product [Didymodactylos carnosus]CAF4316363.1 unnamed protein product [Didymodactylos carnosus]